MNSSTRALLDLISSGITTYDLSVPMELGMAQSPNHPEFRLTMPRRHGDTVRADGGSAANDLLITGTHVGTHVDALGHVSHCGELHGGVDAADAQRGGRLTTHGVDEIEPMVTRGILLDVPTALGIDACAPGYEITTDDLDRTVTAQDTEPRAGDVVLVRSGWGRRWGSTDDFTGRDEGVPGVSEAGARWLAERQLSAVGADTIAFECLKPGSGHSLLPAHRVLLVDAGINIIETLALERLAADSIHEFLFVMAPLHLVGATGSPVRPLAVVTP